MLKGNSLIKATLIQRISSIDIYAWMHHQLSRLAWFNCGQLINIILIQFWMNVKGKFSYQRYFDSEDFVNRHICMDAPSIVKTCWIQLWSIKIKWVSLLVFCVKWKFSHKGPQLIKIILIQFWMNVQGKFSYQSCFDPEDFIDRHICMDAPSIVKTCSI